MKTFFNTINKDVPASEMAIFKLLYEKLPFWHFFSIPL
jgi:hypothetical protein